MKKRKNIDVPEDTLKLLGYVAVSQGLSLKAYIEQSLNEIADSVREDALLLQLSGEQGANEPASEVETAEIWGILNAASLCK